MNTRIFCKSACITLCLLLGHIAPRSVHAQSNLDAEYASQTGTAITIIFDNSGSMQGGKMDEAKQAFKWWLEKSAPAPDAKPGDPNAPNASTTAWSLITFENGGEIAVPFTTDPLNTAGASGSASRRVALAVSRLDAHTNTPIVASLNIAMKQINTRRAKVSPYQRHVVLLFTDGQENADKGGTDAVIRKIRAMRAANVEVVGIAYHGDGDYLAPVATRYYAADSEKQLRAGLARVDAEVDLGGEVVVTQADMRALEVLPAPASSDNGSVIVPHIPRQEVATAQTPAPSAAPLSHPKAPVLMSVLARWVNIFITSVAVFITLFVVMMIAIGISSSSQNQQR